MLKNSFNPNLNIGRIKEIAGAVEIPLVLHGGSGIKEEEVKEAISAGMSIVHISSELRRAYSLGIQDLTKDFFVNNPDEIAPYKLLKGAVQNIQKVVTERLKLFNKIK